MLVFSLDNESGKPLYQQIYEYIKEEIMQGRLSYREKLPSARELAASLLVSRNPVDTAYEQRKDMSMLFRRKDIMSVKLHISESITDRKK